MEDVELNSEYTEKDNDCPYYSISLIFDEPLMTVEQNNEIAGWKP